MQPALLVALAALLAAPAGAQREGPPSRRELEQLVTQLVAVDRCAPDGRARLDALLAPVAGLPLPRESDRAALRKAIAKARAKQAQLPTKAGEHFVDPVTCAEVERGRGGRLFVEGDTRKPKGLLVGLHGGGVGSGDAASSRASYQGLLAKRGWVGLFPEVLEKTERGWTDSGTEEWLVRLVDQAVAEYGVPPDRVYLTGHSMGGYGTWVVGAHHADLFAALAASAGAPTPVYGPSGTIIDVQRGVVPNLRNTPMVVFQSTDDPRVPPDANQGAVRRVEAARARFGGYEGFDYWEVADRGHGFPEGGADALLARVEGFEREPRPRKVVWEPVLDWKRQFHWLDWPAPKLRTTVIAECFPEERRIAVRVEGGDGAGLGVLLCEELLPLGEAAGELVVELNGDEVYRGVPAPALDVWLRTATLGDPGREYTARVALR